MPALRLHSTPPSHSILDRRPEQVNDVAAMLDPRRDRCVNGQRKRGRHSRRRREAVSERPTQCHQSYAE